MLHKISESRPSGSSGPSYVAIQQDIVAAVVAVRQEIGKNPTSNDDWKNVCVEMRKQYDQYFMKEVERGHIPDERGGVDFDTLKERFERIKRVFYRNILPNHKDFKKLTTDPDGSNFLADWDREISQKSGKTN